MTRCWKLNWLLFWVKRRRKKICLNDKCSMVDGRECIWNPVHEHRFKNSLSVEACAVPECPGIFIPYSPGCLPGVIGQNPNSIPTIQSSSIHHSFEMGLIYDHWLTFVIRGGGPWPERNSILFCLSISPHLFPLWRLFLHEWGIKISTHIPVCS